MAYERSEINLEQLAIEIRRMRRHHPLHKVLKEELTKVGHWKDKARGDVMKAYMKSKFGER